MFPIRGLRPYYDELKAWLLDEHNEDGTHDIDQMPTVKAYVDASSGTQSGETTGTAVAGVTLRHPTDADAQIETWLGTTADGGPTDYAVSKLNAAGVGGGAVDSVNGQTGAVVLDAADVGALPDTADLSSVNLFEPLDIWPAFARDGHPDAEWPNNTYAQYIAGIDAKLAGPIAAGDVTKEAIGTSGTESIYAYTSGPASAPHLLIITGSHPREIIGIHAAMRFFTEFVINAHPVMQALRQRVRISYVPTLVPSRHYQLTRLNANGVNVNFNYDFYHDYHGYINGENPGATAFDQTETQAVKGLIDNTQIAALIDCHARSFTAAEIGADHEYSLTSSWVASSRAVGVSAARLWNQLYNADGSYVSREYVSTGSPVAGAGTSASSQNWAYLYLRYVLDRPNAFTLTSEAPTDMAGSTSHQAHTREAMRMYCGFLHMCVAMWLTHGQVPPAIPPMTWSAERTSSASVTTTQTPVTFTVQPWGSSVSRTYIDVPLRSPGSFVVDVNAVFEAGGSATESTRVEIAIGWAKTPVDNSDTTPKTDSTVSWVDIPVAGNRATFHRTYKLAPVLDIDDPSPLHRLQVFVRRVAGDADPAILSASASITHQPNISTDRIPETREII